MRWIIGGLLLTASLAKAVRGDLAGFLVAQGLAQEEFAGLVGSASLFLESLTGLMLIGGVAQRLAWTLTAWLGGAFFMFHAIAGLGGDIEGCRCVGLLISTKAWPNHLLMCIVSLGMCAAAAWRYPARAQTLAEN